MIRPTLVSVETHVTPARMTLKFEGSPDRYVSLHLRGDPRTRDPMVIASEELRALTPDQIEMIYDIAKPVAIVPNPALLALAITQVEQEQRYGGVLYCPACCTKLGHGNSPHIGYLAACHGCRRRLAVKFGPGVVTIVLRDVR